LQQHLPFNALGGVARCGMHHLVSQYSSQFRFIIKLQQEPPVDRDLASRQGPGIRGGIVKDGEFVGKPAVADLCHLCPHPFNVTGQHRVQDVVSTLHLPAGRILLPAYLQLRRL